TRSITSEYGGFASSRLGPTVPFEPASFSVWQPVQPALRNTFFPAVGLPFCGPLGVVVVVVVTVVVPPLTASGSAFTVPSPPQPASATARKRSASTADARRMRRPVYPPVAQRSARIRRLHFSVPLLVKELLPR